jgi:hypothetical protein
VRACACVACVRGCVGWPLSSIDHPVWDWATSAVWFDNRQRPSDAGPKVQGIRASSAVMRQPDLGDAVLSKGQEGLLTCFSVADLGVTPLPMRDAEAKAEARPMQQSVDQSVGLFVNGSSMQMPDEDRIEKRVDANQCCLQCCLRQRHRERGKKEQTEREEEKQGWRLGGRGQQDRTGAQGARGGAKETAGDSWVRSTVRSRREVVLRRRQVKQAGRKESCVCVWVCSFSCVPCSAHCS